MIKRFFPPRLLGMLVAASCTCATLAFAAQVAPVTEKKPPDSSGLIILDKAAPEKGDLPPVVFDHNKHTQALGASPGETCASCHDATLSRENIFRAADGKTGKDLENAFHDSCLSCHAAVASQGKGSPPLQAECRSCHNASALPAAQAAQRKADGGLTPSLHARHIASGEITVPDSADTCAACHHPIQHLSDSGLKVDSCRSCHATAPGAGSAGGATGMAGAPPFAQAAHERCIRCHIALASPERPLPLTCDSCHNAAKKAGYATISPLPRLDAGQPDIVRMGGGSSPENEALPLAPKPLPDGSPAETGRSRASATPVTFDHKRHEAATESCRSCHHNTLQQCSSCHTPAGGAKGGNIPLATAMHKADSPLSCVGCHETRKTAQKECAGCHALTPVKNASQVNCASCHTPLPEPGFLPESSPGAGLPGGNASAPDTLQAAAPPAGTREREALARAPATISIGALANEYEPSAFPHKRVVESLISGMENAAPGMMRFHAEPYALCASCHHNSPPSAAPPPCAACHTKAGNTATTSSPNPIPSLRTAYHRQCMSCHTAMTIKPAATDCAGCHAKRVPLPNGGR